MPSLQELQNTASQVRRDIVRMTNMAGCGHPGGSLGCADLMTALYFEKMTHDPAFNEAGKGEDMFFLSNGHICPVWYSVLARSGYFDVAELATFRKLDSRLQGHPATEEGLPGIRIASGSLGQGMSAAIGAALGKKLAGDDRLVYSLHGDGELQEGQIWEAAMFAAHHTVDNYIATIDYNLRQIDGDVPDVMDLGDLEAKFTAFGWTVLRMDGNDMADVLRVLDQAVEATGQGHPICIIMRTEMGKGVDFMEGTHKWHGVAPNDEQTADALGQLEETLGDF